MLVVIVIGDEIWLKRHSRAVLEICKPCRTVPYKIRLSEPLACSRRRLSYESHGVWVPYAPASASRGCRNARRGAWRNLQGFSSDLPLCHPRYGHGNITCGCKLRTDHAGLAGSQCRHHGLGLHLARANRALLGSSEFLIGRWRHCHVRHSDRDLIQHGARVRFPIGQNADSYRLIANGEFHNDFVESGTLSELWREEFVNAQGAAWCESGSGKSQYRVGRIFVAYSRVRRRW